MRWNPTFWCFQQLYAVGKVVKHRIFCSNVQVPHPSFVGVQLQVQQNWDPDASHHFIEVKKELWQNRLQFAAT